MFEGNQRVKGKINVQRWDREKWIYVWVDYTGTIESNHIHERLELTYYIAPDAPIKSHNHWIETVVHVESCAFYPLIPG